MKYQFCKMHFWNGSFKKKHNFKEYLFEGVLMTIYLLKLIVDLTILTKKKKTERGFWREAGKRIEKGEQATREGGDLRADHVFMQRVSGIVISP